MAFAALLSAAVFEFGGFLAPELSALLGPGDVASTPIFVTFPGTDRATAS